MNFERSAQAGLPRSKKISVEVLNNPEWFPVGFDSNRRELHFAPVNLSQIADMPFHDGRMPLAATNDIVAIELDKLVKWFDRSQQADEPNRLIFHTGFCGSTLLGRALSVPNKTFVLREPRAITQLSNSYVRSKAISAEREDFQLVFNALLARFRYSLASSARLVVKLSNWDNIFIAGHKDILGGSNYSITITSEIRSYIVSVFRGGEPRIRQTLELLSVFGQAGGAYGDLVKKAQYEGGGMNGLSRLFACAYGVQIDALKAAGGTLDISDKRYVTLEALRQSPYSEMAYASRGLHLDLSIDEIKQAWGKNFKSHAKDPTGAQFKLKKEIDFAREIESKWSGDIDSGIAWAQNEGLIS